MLAALVVAVANHLYYNRTGEYENRIFALRDIYSIGVGPAEPFLGDCGHNPIAAGEGVLVIQEIPFCLEVIRSRHIHGEAVVRDAVRGMLVLSFL